MAGEYVLSLVMQAQDNASNAISGLLSKLGPLGGGIAVAGAALVGVGIASVQMAGNFQESMTQLVTGAGESQSNLKLVSDGILNMAVTTGTSTDQLSKGMFMIESAGYHGAQGLQILQVAAEGAKVGNADLGAVSNTLTTILHDYHMKASDAAAAMNGLTATVANGKTHLQDLANSMGNVLPLASSLHISFPQVAGAIAEMTNSGMTAQRASMNLANAIRSLAAPGTTAQKAMKSVGISAQELHDTLTNKGLPAALQLIEQHVGETFPKNSVQYTQAMKAIMGGATGLNVSLMLGGKNMKDYNGNVTAISKSMNTGKGSVQGWADVQKNFNFKVAQAKEMVKTFMIRLGQGLIPVIENGADALGNIIGKIASFVSWLNAGSGPANALKVALIAVGAALAIIKIGNFIAAIPEMLASLGAWIAETWAQVAALVAEAIAEMAANWPIYLIIAVIVLVVLAITHWGAITNWLSGVWHKAIQGIIDMLNMLGIHVGQTSTEIALHTAQMRDKTLAHTEAMDVGSVHHLENMRVNIIAKLKDCKTQAERNTLEMQLKVVDNHLKMKVAALKHTEELRIQNAAKMAKLKEEAEEQSKGLVQKVGDWFANLYTTCVNWIQTTVAKVVNWFINLKNQAVQKVIDFVNGIITWFTNLHTRVVKKVQQLITNIENFFQQLPGKALKWGKDMIQNLINGITSMVGGVTSAVGNIAGKIAGFLHFSKPELGPLASADQWMPHFGDLLASGLQNQVGKLQAAASAMASGAAGGVGAGLSGAPSTASPSASGDSTGAVVNNFTINYVGNGKWTKQDAIDLSNILQHMQRMSGLQPATSSGRRY